MPGLVLSRTPHVTFCDVEYELGALHTRAFEPVQVAVVSPGAQAILYSRLVTSPANQDELHEYVTAVPGKILVIV